PVGVGEEQAVSHAEIGDEAVGRAARDQPFADLVECLAIHGLQADVVEAPASEHRHLVLCFRISLDLENVEFSVRADVDECEHHLVVAFDLARGRAENAAVERDQPRGVVRQHSDVVDAVEQHCYRSGNGPKKPVIDSTRPSGATVPKSMPSSATEPSGPVITHANRKTLPCVSTELVASMVWPGIISWKPPMCATSASRPSARPVGSW